jgi:hypothetical protein
MASNAAHLSQRFQAISQFVSAKISQYGGLAEVNKELANIAPLFNARQLTLQIFSQFPLLSDGLKNFFNAHQGLRQFYSSKISDLSINPTVTSTNHAPTLILKGNSAVGQPEARYKLSTNQSIVVGRDLQHQNDTQLAHIPLPIYKKGNCSTPYLLTDCENWLK